MEKKLNIAIYKTEDREIELAVQLERDTVWLDRRGIAQLFEVEVPAISKHISNIYSDKELSRDRTVSKMEIVRKEGDRKVKRKIEVFSLDMIISIGYRVNSRRATQFRIWATNILRAYLVEGYAINHRRLEEESRKLRDLRRHIKILQKVVDTEKLTLDQSKGLIRVITEYASGLELLHQVDNDSVKMPQKLSRKSVVAIKYTDALREIDNLRERLNSGELFGDERDRGLESSLKSIFQTFEGKDLYPSIEEKAANLLYLIIKNHPFIDGNKRIGSFMFLRFLHLNGILFRSDGTKLVEENAIVAIALMIAQSDRKDKDLMVKLVVNLISGR